MLAGSLTPAVKRGQSCVVIGAGVFGAWTAYYLQRAGFTVTLVDAYGPSNSRASSGGETRIIRCAYGPDELYTRMAQRSLVLWSQFAKRTNPDLLRRSGVLWMAKANNEYVEQSRQALQKFGVPFRDLSATELAKQYPQINPVPGAVAIFEPGSGALMARQAVQTVVDDYTANGGIYTRAAITPPAGSTRSLRSVPTVAGDRISADMFVFACGPWLGKVFPDLLKTRIFPTRQEVLFFGTPPGNSSYSAPAMPVWIDFSDDRGMYGFPDIDRRGFKVAFDRHGPRFDPDSGERIVTPEKVAEARQYVRDRFPQLATAPIIESRVCQYENTSNGDFLIDRHPAFDNVWLVGGGSGHGFKHGPAVGEYVSARVTAAADPPLEARFSLASKGTAQSRTVY